MGCRLDSGIRRTCDAGVADRPTGSRPFSRQQRVAGLESRQIHSRPNGRWYLLKAEAGGESGIRTHGRVSPTHAFQACSFNHSDISPADWNQQFTVRCRPAQPQTVGRLVVAGRRIQRCRSRQNGSLRIERSGMFGEQIDTGQADDRADRYVCRDGHRRAELAQENHGEDGRRPTGCD